MNYQSVFYKTYQMSLENKINFLKDAYKLKTDFWVDVLDCKISSRRQRIKMSFEEILKKFNNECHFVIINRYSIMSEERYGETGFSTMTDPDYFLWVYFSLEDLKILIKKYKLKTL